MKTESLQAFLSILQHIIKPIVDYVKQTIEGRKKKRRTKSVREKKPAGTDGEEDAEVVYYAFY